MINSMQNSLGDIKNKQMQATNRDQFDQNMIDELFNQKDNPAVNRGMQ